MSRVSGKVVLITGGARGVGAATARRLVARGAKVVLVDLDRGPLAELEAELGAHATSITGDVLSLEQMEAAVAHGVQRFGGIDVCVANAGISSYGSVLAVDPAAFRQVVDVNLTGVFHTVRAALPQLIERRGYVLVVSSLAAYAAAPGLVAYNASKAGAEHFANALRIEVAHRGVKVGSAHMSWIDTPLVRDAKQDLSAFRMMLDRLPGPLGQTTSVEACADAFVAGIGRRATRVSVPRWVNAIRWLKPAMTTTLGEREARRHAPEIVPLMDQEVAALGRSMSARTAALQSEAEPERTPAP
ncbi:SDR family oxidoreductase [Baekduia soli]|uniref:SDR family oxidoreductase n=1 Tax=Baekduia soli TaxID=496014 RepID=A0A5B8U3A1_9ACTN|nr:SDR family oxidoreductase [Baekduia soli]QEC47305.1 SDR family oxidoreductase [Baekduia soli]